MLSLPPDCPLLGQKHVADTYHPLTHVHLMYDPPPPPPPPPSLPPSRHVTQVCDAISALGSVAYDTWPELVPFLVSAVQSGQPATMESALNVFDSLGSDQLKPHLAMLHDMFAACLGHASLAVKMASLNATCSLVIELEEAQQRDKLQDLLPAMLAALGGALSSGEEEAAQDALQRLIDVADYHPRFLKKHLPDIVNAMLTVAAVRVRSV